MPRTWPRGLRLKEVASRWHRVKLVGSLAAVVHHVSWRKVERMPKRAKSATDSVQAAAELQ